MQVLGIENLWLFILSSMVFVASPGIDTMLVLNKSLSGGRKIGTYATYGICTGIVFHTLLGVLGLSLLIAQAAYAFTTIKIIGAAYLIYLGIMKLWKSSQPLDVSLNKEKESGKKSFYVGVITNIFNPKVAIFFLAFFPQFINIDSGLVAESFLVLGLIFMSLTLIWFLIITALISVFANFFTKSKKAQKIISNVSGVLFLMMGLKLAFSSNK